MKLRCFIYDEHCRCKQFKLQQQGDVDLYPKTSHSENSRVWEMSPFTATIPLAPFFIVAIPLVHLLQEDSVLRDDLCTGHCVNFRCHCSRLQLYFMSKKRRCRSQRSPVVTALSGHAGHILAVNLKMINQDRMIFGDFFVNFEPISFLEILQRLFST